MWTSRHIIRLATRPELKELINNFFLLKKERERGYGYCDCLNSEHKIKDSNNNKLVHHSVVLMVFACYKRTNNVIISVIKFVSNSPPQSHIWHSYQIHISCKKIKTDFAGVYLRTMRWFFSSLWIMTVGCFIFFTFLGNI